MIFPVEVVKPHIEIYNLRRTILGILSDNTPNCVRSVNVNKTLNETSKLNFTLPSYSEKMQYVINENLVRLEEEYYFIKKMTLDSTKTMLEVECEHESSELKEKILGKFDKIAETVESLMELVLDNTGWVFGGTDIPDSTKRHLITNEQSVFANLVAIAENFNARLVFKTEVINGVEVKGVSLYAQYVDNGRYVRQRKDVKNVNLIYDTNNMVTRLTVFGKADDVTGNEISMMVAHPKNLSYVEDFSYFKNQGYTDLDIAANPMKFVKELIIRNTGLTTSEMVYNYAVDELKRLCVPKVSADVTVSDISCIPDYMTTPIEEGEVIRVIAEDINLVLEANVVGIDKSYSDNPMDTTISISNVIERNSTIKELVESASIVEKIVDGQTQKIHGTYIKDATIGSAQIGKAVIDDAHIKKLSADKIDFNVGTGNILDIQTLLAKFISGESGQFLNLNSNNTLIANAIIKNAMIDSVSLNKVLAGDVSTNKFRIVSDDGGIEIVGATQQFRDRNNKVRMQIGKDEYGNFTLLIVGEDGTTALFDETGIKKDAIAKDLIVENMIAPNSIGERNINYNSLITGLNEGKYELIKSSRVELDSTGQSLDIVFNELKKEINYDVEIISTNGNIFKNGQISTILMAIVRKGTEDITDTIDANRFRWSRVSDDSEGDKAWNNKNFGGSKQITITRDDVFHRATFNCEILEED